MTVSLGAASLALGQQVQATAQVFDASGHALSGASVTWSSSESAIANVTPTGVVQAVAPGKAIIRAVVKSAVGIDSVVVLNPPPPVISSLLISIPDSSLVVGDSAQAIAIPKDSLGQAIDGQVVLWSVASGATVAGVSSTGLITAISPGTATIRGTVGTFSSSVTITVAPALPPRSVASVTIAIAKNTMQVGQVTQAVAVAKDSAGAVISGRPVTWSVDSGATIVSVSTNGTVTAIAVGTARLRATVASVNGFASLTVVAPPPPPPVSSTAVPLVVSRLTAGAGTVLVSNAIPLMPGMLTANGLSSVLLRINGNEVPIAVAATAGTHKDGSLRSIVMQFQYDVPATGVAATLQLGTARSSNMAAQTIPSVPLAVALPTDPNYLMATELVGPTVTQAASKAMSGNWNKYENDFVTYADKHWALTGASWAGNYYDRAQIYYAFWVRTGNPEYWRRGTLIAVDYRTTYLEANNYGSSHHWSQLEGLAEHYWLTGDPASQKAVGRTADNLAIYYRKGVLGDTNHIDMESRIQARSLQAMLLAWEVQAPGGGNYTPATWATHLPSMLTQILRAQKPTGAFLWNGYCGTSINYMNGLLNDVLIRYYQRFQADARIPTSVKANADWLWTNQWRPTGASFNYQSAYCARNNSGPGASLDLNGVYVTTYSWLYKTTGNTVYRTYADSIFAAGVKGAYLTGDKQFNQEYTASYKYLFFRQ